MKRKKYLLIFMCVAFCLGCVIVFAFGCKKQEDLEQVGQNLSHYQLDLVSQNGQDFELNTIFTFVNDKQNVIRELYFHLYPKFFEANNQEYVCPSTKLNVAYPNGLSFCDYQVERVKVNGVDVAVEYVGECDGLLRVGLVNSLLTNQIAKVEIDTQFNLPECCHRFGRTENCINMCNFYPILCAYEQGKFVLDGYNANGDPFYSDMANYDVTITMPKDYKIATTGEGEQTETETSVVLSATASVVRDFAIVMSKDFEVIKTEYKDVNISYYYIDDGECETSLETGKRAIETFSTLFGEYPYSNFSIVQTDFVYGGMEYPNLVLVSTSIVEPTDYQYVIVHETAHQWWYNLVGNDQYNEPYLDEPMVEFCCALFFDEYQDYALTHKQMVEVALKNYTLFVNVYTDVLGKLDTSMRGVNDYSTEPEYTYCIYVKGLLMYDSLYNLIGEKAFVSALKDYFENNKYTNATIKDLITSFSKISKRDLTAFFDSWISGKVVVR